MHVTAGVISTDAGCTGAANCRRGGGLQGELAESPILGGQHVEGTLDALGDFFRTLGRVSDGGPDGRNHGLGQLATEGKGLMHASDLWWFRSRQGGRLGRGPAPPGRVDSGRCDALAKDGRQLVHHVQLPAQAGLLGRLRMGSRLSPADPQETSIRQPQSGLSCSTIASEWHVQDVPHRRVYPAGSAGYINIRAHEKSQFSQHRRRRWTLLHSRILRV